MPASRMMQLSKKTGEEIVGGGLSAVRLMITL
jgi:hypothetical protein